MDETIIATYCLCDDLLQAMHHRADPQCKMSDAEVMTTALTAALFFRGTLESARMMLKQHGYIPQMLSKSHFNRRLHRLKETFMLLFNLLGDMWKRLNYEAIYVIDSCPLRSVITFGLNETSCILRRCFVAISPARNGISMG